MFQFAFSYCLILFFTSQIHNSPQNKIRLDQTLSIHPFTDDLGMSGRSSTIYNHISQIQHHGETPTSGHYTTFATISTSNNHRWAHFDDSVVTLVDDKEVTRNDKTQQECYIAVYNVVENVSRNSVRRDTLPQQHAAVSNDVNAFVTFDKSISFEYDLEKCEEQQHSLCNEYVVHDEDVVKQQEQQRNHIMMPSALLNADEYTMFWETINNNPVLFKHLLTREVDNDINNSNERDNNYSNSNNSNINDINNDNRMSESSNDQSDFSNNNDGIFDADNTNASFNNINVSLQSVDNTSSHANDDEIFDVNTTNASFNNINESLQSVDNTSSHVNDDNNNNNNNNSNNSSSNDITHNNITPIELRSNFGIKRYPNRRNKLNITSNPNRRSHTTNTIRNNNDEVSDVRSRPASINFCMRPLTDEESDIVNEATEGIGDETQILATLDANTVQRGSMRTLRQGKWLNDEVINYYLKLLIKRDEIICAQQSGRRRSHIFNSFFTQYMFDEMNNNPTLRGKYNYKNIKRWSKKVPGKDIFNLKYILCPINVHNKHWTLGVIYMEDKRIRYFDSTGGTDRAKLKGLLQFVIDEYKAKNDGKEMNVSEWELVSCTSDTPKQNDGFNCGAFLLSYCDFILQDCELKVTQSNIDEYRRQVALSIMKNNVIE
jgi:sentrin-specific protease 1